MDTMADLEDVVRKVLEEQFVRMKARCVEELLVILPSIIGNLIKTTAETERTVREFYEQHRDLLPYKMDVARMVEKHEAANPGKPLAEIMHAAADDVRRMHAMGRSMHSTALPALTAMDTSLGAL